MPARNRHRRDGWNTGTLEPEKEDESNSFLTYTTAHGFRHIVDSQNTVHRCLWSIILLLSVVMLSFQLHELFVDYAREPTASVVTTTFPTKFPPIVLCPHSWANVTKAKEQYNMTTDKFRYLESLFEQLQYHIRKELTDTVISDPEELKSIESELQQILSTYTNGSLDDLFMAISYEPDEMFVDFPFNFDVDKHKFVTMTGVCYRITSNETYTANYQTIRSNFVLLTKQLRNMFYNETEYPELKLNSFGVGTMMDSVNPQSEVYIRQRMHYYAKITYRLQKRVSLRRQKCDSSADASYSKLMRCAYASVRPISLFSTVVTV